MEKKSTKKIINWLKRECRDYKTLLIFICVIIIMYMPVWGGYLLYYIFRNNIFLTTASIVAAFWIGPFTPFFPLAITITIIIRKFVKTIKFNNVKSKRTDIN